VVGEIFRQWLTKDFAKNGGVAAGLDTNLQQNSGQSPWWELGAKQNWALGAPKSLTVLRV